jgi:putative ABC transport system permease protein
MNVIHLDVWDLAAAAVLIVLDAILSAVLRLNVHRQILIAAGRMVIQLLLVGVVLRLLFASASAAGTLVVIAVMVAAAAREVAVRPKERLARGGNYTISGIVVSFASFATVLLALLTAVRPEPWHDARYSIPLMGIVLGSVLNAGSITLDTMLGSAKEASGKIEAQLALGRHFRTAVAPMMRQAIRRGMIPIVNQMSAAGIITLPGTMTGQLLAGMDPIEAAKYQILLMFLLAGASGLAAVATAFLAVRSLTDERERLRLDRLV